MQDVYAFFQGSVTAFGGFGIAVAVALLLVLRFVVPYARRRVVRAPVLLLLFSVAFAILNSTYRPERRRLGASPAGHSASGSGWDARRWPRL